MTAKQTSIPRILTTALLLLAPPAGCVSGRNDLPSWNDGPSRHAITSFVDRVTTAGNPGFVPAAERIAVFDNDGTLWAEQPMYFQGLFAFDRIKALAPQHTEWKDREPYRSVIAGDMKGLAAAGDMGLLEIMAATHTGMTTDEFAATAREWSASARHPTLDRRYTECVYQPMLELLTYLRANDFKPFIVSGGGVEFMRAFTEQTYGIPPEQVVGSSGVVKYELRNGAPALIKEPKLEFLDDGPGKPAAINRFIGRRPIAAFGNSDGDLQMLQWTTVDRGDGDRTPRFGLIIHHTDAQREWAYDRASHIGRLDKALDEAASRGWTVVDVKRDWKRIFPSGR